MQFIHNLLSKLRAPKQEQEDDADYILWVTTKTPDGDCSSHWQGWTVREKWTREDAEQEKKRIEHLYDEVEILKITP